MDSSFKNPNFTNRKPPFPPPISPQFHHHYTLNQPLPHTQTSPWILQPSGWVDSWIVDPNYRISDCYNGGFRSRDGFCSFGNVRIQGNYGDCRSLGVGNSFGYGNVSYGDKRWLEMAKDGYYRSEIEPYLDDVRRKSSDEPDIRVNEDREQEMNFTTRDNTLDRTVVSQAEGSNFSGSLVCESAVNSLVENVRRKEFVETLPPLSSIAEIDDNVGGDAGKYTSSSSPENVAGKGSSDVQDMDWEDVSFPPNQDLGLSSNDSAEIPDVDQSSKLDYGGLKTCLSESNVSLGKDTNVGASEFYFSSEGKEKASVCDSPPVLEIENSIAVGNMGSSGSYNDSECTILEAQPCSVDCMVFPNGNIGNGTSHVTCSFKMSTVDKDLVDDPLRSSSCLVTDSSVSPCHLSPSASVNEQIQNSASSVEANCSSQCGIIEKESDRAENMDVDIQEEEVEATGTSGTDSVTVDGTKQNEECNKEEIIVDASQGGTSIGTDESCELHMDKCGDGVSIENPDCESIEKLIHVPSNPGSQEVSLNIANTDVYVGEALSSGGKILGAESPGNSDVLPSKVHSHADDNCAVAPVKDYVVALSPPDSQSKTALSYISEKTQKRANILLHATQKSYPSVNVTKHHTWQRMSNTSASPIVASKPKVTVQSSSTYVRRGNSLVRKPSPGSLGEAQTLQRHSRPPSDNISGKCALSADLDSLSSGSPGSSSEEADDPEFGQNGSQRFEAIIQRGYASDCRTKKNTLQLESSNPSKMFYVKRKANQLVAASDIHGASHRVIPPSGAYFKKSRNQLVRNSKSLPYQENPLSDDALNLQTAAKTVSKRSSSLSLSESAVMRPFNQSKFSHVWRQKEPLSRKANRVHISPQKILSRKSLMMRTRLTVYRRSANGYSLKKSKVLSIGGSHLKWFNSNEKDSQKPEHLLDVESSRSYLPELGKDMKKSSIPNRLGTGSDKSVWIRNGNQLVRDPKKRLANEKVRWSLHNVRLRSVKKKKYCQFFTKFGKCNKDGGKCPYIHDPSKIAVCKKFLSGLCSSPDCRLTHKVVPESMPDCYYYLQGLCNNEVCPYRHVHVNPKAAICEGFLRGYCSDGRECRKKHTYTCPVFEATGYCSQESKCKFHHPKNRSKEKKRKRESQPWQKISRGRYFGSMHKDLPQSERISVNELAADSAIFGGESPDFIRLDFNEHGASEDMDSSTTESASDDSETQDSIDELIRPVGLMQEQIPVHRVHR